MICLREKRKPDILWEEILDSQSLQRNLRNGRQEKSRGSQSIPPPPGFLLWFSLCPAPWGISPPLHLCSVLPPHLHLAIPSLGDQSITHKCGLPEAQGLNQAESFPSPTPLPNSPTSPALRASKLGAKVSGKVHTLIKSLIRHLNPRVNE